MSLKVLLLTVCLVLTQTRALQLQCEDMRETNLATSNEYLIRTPGQTFQANQELTIEFEGRSSVYKSIIFQAKRVGSNIALGTWIIDPPATLFTCTEANTSPDTVVLTFETTVSYASSIWRAPAILSGDIEFHAIFVDADGYKHFQHSIFMMATVPEEPEVTTAPPVEEEVDQPDEVPEVDLHNDRTEAELQDLQREKAQKEIEMEDLASEDDINRVDLEEEKRHEEEIHWEEMQYEVQMKQEEVERQARIRAEIQDREDFDKEQAERDAEEEARRLAEEERKRLEEEEGLLEDDSKNVDIGDNDIDIGDTKDNGSSRTMATLPMIWLSLWLTFTR